MKKLITLLLCVLFSFGMMNYAFADVAGMGFVVAYTLVVPVLIIAILIIAIVLISRAIKKARSDKEKD